MMTCRERIEAALGHRQPDRTPIFEYVLRSPRADELLGRDYAADPLHWNTAVAEKGWESAVRQNAVDQLDLAMLLGHDMMYVVPNPISPKSESSSTVSEPRDIAGRSGGADLPAE